MGFRGILERHFQGGWAVDEADAHGRTERQKHDQIQDKHNLANDGQSGELMRRLIEEQSDSPGAHGGGEPAPRDLADALLDGYGHLRW